MRVVLCGVRGSTPAPGPEFVRHGGHTSCVAIAHDGDPTPRLILDSGTGIRRVTSLMGGAPFDGTILLTHLHWDHVQGLPFFSAGDNPDSRVSLLLPEQEDGTGAVAILSRAMSPPHFPIGPEKLRGRWTFGSVAPGRIDVEGFTVDVLEVPHKGGRTFGYRVSDGRRAIAYIPDHCPTDMGTGPDGWGEYHDNARALAKDVDALLHDAQLLPAELPREAAFGHAAADYAVGLAGTADARRVVLFHHRPDRSDDALDDLRQRLDGGGVPVDAGAEGMVLDL